MDVVERVCDHIGVIRSGRIVASGPIDEIRAGRRLEDAFIAAVGAEHAAWRRPRMARMTTTQPASG